MNTFDNQIIFKQLLDKHHRIQIPMIQRDYAQGRETEEEVRNEFLNALFEALILDPEDSALPLNLDFIYGSVEGGQDTSFLPLDGQQRLTTLFLLHWYLAWKDGCLEHFKELMCLNDSSRFSYSVRQSSTEFFDALMSYSPDISPDGLTSVKSLMTNQPWYFRYWRLDPTIQASLIMLDSIHKRFNNSEGLYSRLVDEEYPAITFELLDLENFGLSDDLYIKMNARGKPLTVFETFKARYEQDLEKLFKDEFRNIGNQRFTVVEYFARRMDTQWADFFWVHRDKETKLFDGAVMNLFHALIMVTRDSDSDAYVDDITLLRNKFFTPSYTRLHEKGWLDRKFSETLFLILEEWSKEQGVFSSHLPDTQYFDEEAIYQKVVHEPAGIDYTDIILFVAYVEFIENHGDKIDPQVFQDWMRVIYNLSINTVYNRPSDMQRSISSVLKLVSNSGDILGYMASPDSSVPGFRQQQVSEEQVKAELIQADAGWWPLIEQAEGHGYFNGQIEFLLDFSGVIDSGEDMSVSDWEQSIHQSLQNKFKEYLEKANLMFNPRGLISIDDQLWERALLSIGDYLLPKGSNYSFLVNSSTDDASWKRLLRGGEGVPRDYLHKLWDRLNTGDPFNEQLVAIINNTSDCDGWIKAFIDTPEAIEYCGNRAIRWVSEDEIYLLKKSQMNGTHAELYTYCLYSKLKTKFGDAYFKPLFLSWYRSVNTTDVEPSILFDYEVNEGYVELRIKYDSYEGQFKVSIDTDYLEPYPEVREIINSNGFILVNEIVNDYLVKLCPSSESVIQLLSEMSKKLPIISYDEYEDD